jgi:hypothetical protein
MPPKVCSTVIRARLRLPGATRKLSSVVTTRRYLAKLF